MESASGREERGSLSERSSRDCIRTAGVGEGCSLSLGRVANSARRNMWARWSGAERLVRGCGFGATAPRGAPVASTLQQLLTLGMCSLW